VNTLVQMLIEWLKKAYLDPVILTLKAQAAHVYLEGMKGARGVLVLLCLLVFVITLVGAGLVLIPIALLIFMPWQPQTKAVIGIVVGAVYLLAPLVATRPLLSEKRWLSVTGADETVKRMLE
jgi:hypothetical protein